MLSLLLHAFALAQYQYFPATDFLAYVLTALYTLHVSDCVHK
jgi:hypothetical protein